MKRTVRTTVVMDTLTLRTLRSPAAAVVILNDLMRQNAIPVQFYLPELIGEIRDRTLDEIRWDIKTGIMVITYLQHPPMWKLTWETEVDVNQDGEPIGVEFQP
jgi:hypothetical protein